MAKEYTTEEILAFAGPSEEYEAYVKQNGPPPTPVLDVNVARANMEKNLKARVMKIPIPEGVAEEDITVPARDGYQIPCRLHKPQDGTAGPLLVVFHAGGFVAGGPFQEFTNCRAYVKSYSATCINVDYRLAPEHQFPTAVYDSFDVISWAAENASKLGADASKGFLLVGTSAGANISNACVHLARDLGMSPPITGIHLAAPLIIAARRAPEKYKDIYLSWEQNRDAPFLNRESCFHFSRLYNPDRHSPLYHSIDSDHTGLPPVCIQSCGADVFRDDGIIYDKMLRLDAGVETKIDVYTGMPHGFWALFPNFEVSKRAFKDRIDGVGWLLERSKQSAT